MQLCVFVMSLMATVIVLTVVLKFKYMFAFSFKRFVFIFNHSFILKVLFFRLNLLREKSYSDTTVSTLSSVSSAGKHQELQQHNCFYIELCILSRVASRATATPLFLYLALFPLSRETSRAKATPLFPHSALCS